MRRLLFAVAGAAALVIQPLPVSAAGPAGAFDYYILSLSWSPTYCATEGENDRAQCDTRRDYGFIVHGLWPMRGRGSADYCNSSERWLSDEVIASVKDLIPSKGLAIHEWKKHGVCSGLGQRGYFDLLRRLAEGITVPEAYRRTQEPLATSPDALAADFAQSNPGLTRDMLVVRCRGAGGGPPRLTELRICFDRAGREMRCPADQLSGNCRSRAIALPAPP
ncbi:MAG: ribonuclease [Hyphomicrobiales bacterium]